MSCKIFNPPICDKGKQGKEGKEKKTNVLSLLLTVISKNFARKGSEQNSMSIGDFGAEDAH